MTAIGPFRAKLNYDPQEETVKRGTTSLSSTPLTSNPSPKRLNTEETRSYVEAFQNRIPVTQIEPPKEAVKLKQAHHEAALEGAQSTDIEADHALVKALSLNRTKPATWYSIGIQRRNSSNEVMARYLIHQDRSSSGSK
jgi:hypothetical protein